MFCLFLNIPARAQRALRCLVASGFLCALAKPILSQQQFPQNPSTIQGPTANSVSTATETVNNSNGDVVVSIPLLSRPGIAGLDFNLSLMYDSKNWDLKGEGQPGVTAGLNWRTADLFPPDFGFGRLSLPRIYSEDLVVDSFDDGTGEPAQVTCQTHFMFRDSDGSVHSFDNSIDCHQSHGGGASYDARLRTITDTLDGSMMRLDISDAANAKIILKNGTILRFNLTATTSDTGTSNRYIRYAKSITDRYGNQITLTGEPNSTMTVTDTLGRVVTISNANRRITYKNSSGGDVHIDQQTTALTTQSATLHAEGCHFFGIVQPGGDVSNFVASHDVGGTGGTRESLNLDSQGIQRTFTVDLNALGEIIKVAYPTGGYTSYTYQSLAGTYGSGDYACNIYPVRQIYTKGVCDSSSGTCSSEKTTTYTPTLGTLAGASTPASSNSQMSIVEPADDQGHQRKVVHDFGGTYGTPSGGMRSSRETKEWVYDNLSTLLRTTDTSYTNYVDYTSSDIIWSSRPKDVVQTMYGASGAPVQSTRTHYEYDVVTLLIGSPSATSTYSVYSDQPSAITVYDPSDNVLQSTTMVWKNTGDFTPGGNHVLDLLASRTVTSSTDNSTVTDTYSYDGVRLTGVDKNGTGVTTASVSYTVDMQGRTTKFTDPRSNSTNYTYTNPWFNTSCAVGTTSPQPVTIQNALSHTVTAKYYPCSGLLASVTDANNATTSYTYDSLDRLTGTSYADGGTTSVTYTDSTHIQSSRLQSASVSVVTKAILDGLGRAIEMQLLNDPACASTPGNTSRVLTTYDALGRKNSVTNPYCSTTELTYGIEHYSYDALDRPTITTHQDGNKTHLCYNNLATDTLQEGCGANLFSTAGSNTSWVNSRDEAGHQWQRVSDAVGRLTHVYEDAGGTNLHTEYSYDGFNNLRSAKQYGTSSTVQRERTFTYDTFSRLLTANNPETGIICYGIWDDSACKHGYDDNGNLQHKTNARGAVTSYSYDALNRLTQISHSDATPTRHFSYDQTHAWATGPGLEIYNGIGRLTQANTDPDGRIFPGGAPGCAGVPSSGNGGFNPAYGNPTFCDWTDELYSYDAMGRIIKIFGATPSEAGHDAHYVYAGYDFAGNRTSLIYPDGSEVKQTWDGGGRLQQVEWDNWRGQHIGRVFAGNFSYFPGGQQNEVYYNNHDLKLINQYNNRNQMCQIWVGGTQDYIDDRIHYAPDSFYNFCGGEEGNNGNVREFTDLRGLTRSQYFSYDSLNRISSFTTGGASQAYSYDPFGNLSKSGTLSSVLSFDSNNRINSGGYGYDPAGNITSFNNGVVTSHYDYDAEDRLFRTDTGFYTYDATGNRMRKDPDNSNANFTEYQYLDGQPIAEKSADGHWTNYIYANGKRIAQSRDVYTQLHLHGNYPNSTCSTQMIQSGLGGYQHLIKTGDKLYFMKKSTIAGGLKMVSTLGPSVSTDILFGPTGGVWQAQIYDLDALAGQTIGGFWPITQSGTSGTWDESFADISIFSQQDGSVTPVFTNHAVSYSVSDTCGSNPTMAVETVPVDHGVDYFMGLTYYVPNHLGTSMMEFSLGPWPISSSTYMPFGETLADSSQSHYKFTGKERDAESGLDYSTFRTYGSTMGRWISPDPGWFLAVHKGDPQTWNMYAYVGNNPLRYTDPFGLSRDCRGDGNPSVVCIATSVWDWLKGLGGSTQGGNGSTGAGGAVNSVPIPNAGNYFLRVNYDTGANSQNVREIQYQLYSRASNQAVTHQSHPNSDLFIFETQTAKMGALDQVGDFFANTHENTEAFTFTDQVGGRCFLWCDTISSTQNFYLQTSSGGIDTSRRYPLSVEVGGRSYTSLQIKIKQMGLFSPGAVLIEGASRWPGVPRTPPNP